MPVALVATAEISLLSLIVQGDRSMLLDAASFVEMELSED